ncbi:DUF4474 domain-containing protein [Anoxybacterium hadale]|uniref:DUF4474 domain-containing protein n=1 Tax=Anoxybacterium hadale TaxID=3408580 RepID=A0ACD1A725_9FIRM|nr:DUF4474 domain-containing protein [Clostridiales bacterium]
MLVFASLSALLLVFVILIYRMIYSIICSIYPKPEKTEAKAFDQLLSYAGYQYDPEQDIFFSRLDAWQREFGYCRLYDEAAAPASIIIDAEPVTFVYGGKRWLIQFWKGQYYLNTGCEIGVYYTDQQDLNIPGLFTGTFYQCAADDDLMELSYVLFQKGRKLFERTEKHWWLSGFKAGVFSEPEELAMHIKITFLDETMCEAFVAALIKIGYQRSQIKINGTDAEFIFDRTHTPKPFTRSEKTDRIIQNYNRLACKRYRQITSRCRTMAERICIIRRKEPLFYEGMIRIGKTRRIIKAFYELIEHGID